MQLKNSIILAVALCTFALVPATEAESFFNMFFPGSKPCTDSTKCQPGYTCYETEGGAAHACIFTSGDDSNSNTKIDIKARAVFSF
ncbi:hypothetical protein BDF19DRAFT_432674 [Syncephalis fuscata]|nr:hypothetical protein BDF19DRAFT_432674 [Syncephalis fuscata]